MMYAHQWLPIPAVVGALFVLCAPYLALIALVVVVFAAVAMLVALGGAIVAGLYALARPVALRIRSGALERSTGLSTVEPRDARLMIYGQRGE